MLNKTYFLLVFMISITFTGFTKPVKVSFAYNIEGVSLIYNDLVYKECPKDLLIDFQLGGQVIAFKSGYESQIIKITGDNIFTTHIINLQKSENKLADHLLEVELKKVLFINYVTNYTEEEVTDIINIKLNACNIATPSQNRVFENAKINKKQYAIGAEVVKSTSKNGAYTSPYYLLSHQKIKWFIVDNSLNTVVLELTTEGFYLAYFKAKKGMVASDRLKEITVFSLEEAVQKFVNSPEFTGFILQTNKK